MSEAPPIAACLPQQGAMVLLDAIVASDDRCIVCRAYSHRDPANPLASGGMLPIWAGIEYAAQAMAAHFALGPGNPGSPAVGLLGGLRDVVCATARLDDVEGALRVEATRLAGDPAGTIYAFAISAEAGGRELMRGRATVVQRKADAS